MTDAYVSDELHAKLKEAAELIDRSDNRDATLAAAYDHLVAAVEKSNHQTSVLVLRMIKPADPADKNAAKNAKEKWAGTPQPTPYKDWEPWEKEAFPGGVDTPDPSYLLLHLNKWCYYTSTGKKCV